MEELLDALRRFRDERDWVQFHSPKNLAMSVSIEAAELLERFQWHDDSAEFSTGEIALIADEAADVMIYTLMIFDRLGLDPRIETLRKIEKNAARYPAREVFGRPGADFKR